MPPAPRNPDLNEAVSQIEIACPRCNTLYRIAANLAGRKFQCRKCQNVWRWGPGEKSPRGSSAPQAASDTRLTVAPTSGGLPTAGDAPSAIIDMSWANRKLGRYTLTSLLGRGGMGVVWRANDPTLKRDVAIKILTQPSNGSGHSLNRALFLQEARAAAMLNHPGAITVFEIAEDAGHAFIAMELMHGGTLKDRIDRTGPIEPREAFRLLVSSARALSLAHARGIIHRDIKPGNLMFDDHGHLKLGDFGLSDVAGDPASASMRGKSVGSLGWIAPETARGEPTTPLSDIYAFGLILLYALTGRQWLAARDRSALLELHQNPPEPKLDEIPDLSEDGRALLLRCLAKDPIDRFQSAEEMATFLEHCAHEPVAPVAPSPPSTNGQYRILIIALVTAVVATTLTLLGIFGFLTRTESKNARPLTPKRTTLRPAPRPIPPASTAPSEPIELVPSPDAAEAARYWTATLDEQTLRYIASRSGATFHTPLCDGGRRIYLSNLMRFDTVQEAEAAGKKPCPNCRPNLFEHAAGPERD